MGGDKLVLSLLQNRKSIFTLPVTFLLYLLIFIGIKAALAYRAGALYIPGLASVATADIGRYPPFVLLLARFVKHPVTAAANPPAFPYLRDYSEILLMVLMAAEMVLIQRLWEKLSLGLRILYLDGTINPA